MFNDRVKQQLPSPLQDDIRIDSLTKPYRDNPVDQQETSNMQPKSELPLPRYEPMHDYLRRQNCRFMATVGASSPSSSSSSSLSSQCPLLPNTTGLPPSSSYTDEPFLINLADTETPPPSYYALHQQHELELQSLRGAFMHGGGETYIEEDEEDDDESGLQVEDLVKWVVVMLMISLMVAFIGTLFDWGRSPQSSSPAITR